MKIKVSDKEKVITALSTAQKGARARLVDYIDLVSFCEKAEEIAEKMGLSKKARGGLRARWFEYVSCNAYKKKSVDADSTFVELTRGAGGQWYLTACHRQTAGTGRTEKKDLHVILTWEQKQRSQKRLFEIAARESGVNTMPESVGSLK